MTTTYYLNEGRYEADYKVLHELYLAGNDYYSLHMLVSYLEDVQGMFDEFGTGLGRYQAEQLSPSKFRIVGGFARYIQDVSGATPTPSELSDILYDLHMYLEEDY